MRNVDEFTDEVFRRKDVQVVKQKERRQAVHRKVTALVTVLAIVLTVGAVGVGAAVLSGSDWFANLYKRETHGELSESQLQYLADNTVDIQQTVTSDGITMTLGAVHSSRHIFDVYIHVIAPEDMSLDGVNLGIYDVFTLTREDGHAIPFCGMQAYYVQDDDGRDNTRTYAFRVDAPEFGDYKDYIFAQGGPLKMTINGLAYGAHDSVASWGRWSFDLTFSDKDEGEKVIITEPVVVNSYSWGEDKYVGKVEISSFTLYELLGVGTFEVLELEKDAVYDDTHVNVQVFFKDGTSANATSGQRGGSEFQIGKVEQFESGFSEPIILSEVDYVVFGGYEDRKGNLIDGVRVDVP